MQYVTPANLGARQAIYRFREPAVDFYDWALDLAGLAGPETVVDVGCGNGGYLATLRRRGHRGLTVGVDFSSGMLATARRAGGTGIDQPVVQADAMALPVADGCADVVLAMHMLYHVPDKGRALEEFQRVLGRGGRALVLLNGAGHLRQLRRLVSDLLVSLGEPAPGGLNESLDLDAGEALASRLFDVERHEIDGELVVPEPAPVLSYVRSMNFLQSGAEEEAELLRLVEARVSDAIAAEGAFRIATSSGCLVCR